MSRPVLPVGISYIIYMYVSCLGKKRTKRSRVKGRYEQMRPLYNPPPHRRYFLLDLLHR